MIITKEKYKEILDIQGVPYTENSKWFETSLERINQALSLADVVGQSEQLPCELCSGSGFIHDDYIGTGICSYCNE